MEPTEPPRKNYGLKPREFERLNSAEKAPEKSTEHDVFAMLQQNRSIEQQAGKDNIEFKEIKSRRKRDYWLLLIGGNLLIIGLVAMGGLNPVNLIYGLSGIVVLSLGLTWVMWFVMDDY